MLRLLQVFLVHFLLLPCSWVPHPRFCTIASWKCLSLSDPGLLLLLHWRTIHHGCLGLGSNYFGLVAGNFLFFFPIWSIRWTTQEDFPSYHVAICTQVCCLHRFILQERKFKTRDWVSCLRPCAGDGWYISEGYWDSCLTLLPLPSTTPSPGLISTSLEKENDLGKDTLWVCEVAQLWSQLESWPLVPSIQITQWHSIFLCSELLYPGDGHTSPVSSSQLCYLKLADSWVRHMTGVSTCTMGFYQKPAAPWSKGGRR